MIECLDVILCILELTNPIGSVEINSEFLLCMVLLTCIAHQFESTFHPEFILYSYETDRDGEMLSPVTMPMNNRNSGSVICM